MIVDKKCFGTRYCQKVLKKSVMKAALIDENNNSNILSRLMLPVALLYFV